MEAMNPYVPIRKVPLDYNGIKSSAYSVQSEDYCKTGEDEGKPVYGNKWKEKGVVSSNYLLIPNAEVKEMGEVIANGSGIEWNFNKTFFNGRQYMFSMTTTEITGEVKLGDDVSLGFAMWNSYDGSRALSFELFLNRLICMNGMVTRKSFVSHRFKHDANSIEWKGELEKVTDLIHNVPMDNYLDKFRLLSEGAPMDCNDLSYIRGSCLPKVPTSTWGKILDKMFRDKEYDEYRPWDLLNASTNVLWHNKKQTIADFNMNGYIVEGMCNYVT